jgi:hypothetical protein
MRVATFELLENADLPARQARAIAHAIEMECAAQHDPLATKLDLVKLGADLRTELHQLLHDTKSELVRWMFLVMLGQTAALAAAGYFYIGQLVR